MQNFFNFNLIEMLKRLNQLNGATNQPYTNSFQQIPYTSTTADLSYHPMQSQSYNKPYTEPITYSNKSMPTFNQNSLPKYTDILSEFQFPETNKIQSFKRNIMSEDWNRIDDGGNMESFAPKNQGIKLPNVLNKKKNEWEKSILDNWGDNQPKQLDNNIEQPSKTDLDKQFEQNFKPEIKTEQAKPDVLKPQELKPLTLDEQHQKAKEFKSLYSDVSKNLKNIKNSQDYSNGDWHYLDSRFDKDSNYKAVALKNDKTGEISVFNIGTDKRSLKDLKTDKDMIFNDTPKQFKKAKEYHKELSDKYGDKYKINSIGHSEGGSESQYVGLNNKDINVYTYNAYGIGRNKEIKDLAENSDTSNIYNYRDSRDPVSKHGKNVGEEYIVESDKKRFLPFGYFKFHGIDNMAEIDNPINIKDYKKKNPRFVSDMNKVLLSAEDVGKMDSDTFKFYEPYIDELLKKKLLMPSYELNKRISNGMNIRYNPAGYYQFL